MPTMTSVTNKYHYCLFKGEPGTRKSSTALSYPTPQYWFDFDGKMAGLSVAIKQLKIDPSVITYDTYTDWNAAANKLELLAVQCQYKTIVIDSITSCADTMLRQVRRNKAGKGKSIGGIPVSSVEDFNAESSAISELIALTKQIQHKHGCNIILIGHVTTKENRDSEGKVTSVARTLVTAATRNAQKIPAYATETYHFDIDKSVHPTGYKLLTTNTGDDFARTSLPLPREVKLTDDLNFYKQYIEPLSL